MAMKAFGWVYPLTHSDLRPINQHWSVAGGSHAERGFA
jgi:hypothetical protein